MISTARASSHYEYLSYLDDVYKEVIQFFTDRGEMPDPEKVKFFVSMTARPYYYWEQERNQARNKQTSPMINDMAKRNLLEALQKKYKLRNSSGAWTLSQALETAEFKRLAEKMEEAGYRYNRDRKAFVEVI